jgi:peptidoglycan/xylan/chitin deacetylase (PgdA/CDA1 family)
MALTTPDRARGVVGTGAARLASAVRHPRAAAVSIEERTLARRRLRRTGERARAAGLDGRFLVLSFDCDTDEDAEVVESVHARLATMDVCPVYAVPGELLIRARDVYARLAANGAEFINHGHVSHTFFDEEAGRHASCFFYDEQSRERVERDIVEGHRTLESALGVTPLGFRTPHFGTFQRTEQLRWLHRVLRTLDYRYSSSTGPRFGLRHGPVLRRFGLLEFPVSGMPSMPYNPLDSWICFASSASRLTADDFVREAEALATLTARSDAGLINVYADPSHVHDRDEFFDAVRAWSAVAEPIGYRALADHLS